MSASSSHGLAGTDSRPRVVPARETKVLTAEEAARLIFDGETLAIGGFVGMAVPEALLIALADRFERTGRPRNLTLVFTD
jgi:propionate CoA-transferase